MKKDHANSAGTFRPKYLLLTACLCLIGVLALLPATGLLNAQTLPDARRVNAPYFDGGVQFSESAVFWFGQVDNTTNYSDVRVGYNQNELMIHVTSFDRWLWYDTSPSPGDLTAWDSASLYLNITGNTGTAPTANSYRFDLQFNHNESRTNYQTAYQGNGSGWASAAIPFTSDDRWRGNGVNDGAEDRGWMAIYTIPFASLGLNGPPAAGTVWGLAVAVHDRDDAAGTLIADQGWPDALDTQQPETWGQLAFGIPAYQPPFVQPDQMVTVRQGLNGAAVADAHVGGHSTCGSGLNFWSEWGNKNYAGYEQINIQNQWDVADWPCFSKYFVTFPLTSLPACKTVISATLTMYQFGNANQDGSYPEPPRPSLIQVSTITDAWNESTITWNNAPLAWENTAQSWVDPVQGPINWPGWARRWDVGRAVAEAYGAGTALNLALYSADDGRHSGKYFSSSDTGDWNAEGRPTLQVSLGHPLSVAPAARTITPGGVATYTIRMMPDDSCSTAFSLVAASPSPSVALTLAPSAITPAQQATLVLTDTHIGSSLMPGAFYTIPITATGGGSTQRVEVTLLVGGESVYLPLVIK
ncbi:MAG: DNRLRE domain-containing protein [Anaerolineae bacterium]